MAFAILRTAKLKTAGNIGGLNNHLTRAMDVPNADPELIGYNSRPIGTENLLQDIQNRLSELEIIPRKNAVLAIEHLMTASPEAFAYEKYIDSDGKTGLRGQVDTWKAFKKDCFNWLSDRYGTENIVNITVHLDESTPHLHAVVVPIDSRKKLNCRAFLGGREKMSEMQTSFAEKVKHLGLERGIEGSKAIHQDVKAFYGRLSDKQETFEIEKIAVKAPEKGFLGLGYKQDPAQLAQEETNRINLDLLQAENKINKKLQEVKYRQINIDLDKNKLKGLEATKSGKLGQANRLLEEKDLMIEKLQNISGRQSIALRRFLNGELNREGLQREVLKITDEIFKKNEIGVNTEKSIGKNRGLGM